ncbi:MAG: ATP-binding cassette domain-containing protein [Burkholderiales bacterium]|nr:ATP-binding cassette domain-containing protein [Burkholderiales bacterium]
MGSFLNRRPPLQALRGLTLAVEEREVLALVGESGCGKSTLARLLLGFGEPNAGRITISGRPIASYSRLERAALIQPIFQDPYSSLNPRMTVAATIGAPLEVRRIGDSMSRHAAVRRMMDAVGLAPDLSGAYPMQLSGGQRQRVAIARALIGEPKILVCDEPTSALDVSVQSQILNLIAGLHREFNLTIILITHNLAVVSHLADRIAVMYLGRLVEIGACSDIFAAPHHPYTRELLRAALPAQAGIALPVLGVRGEFPSPTAPPPGCGFHPRCPRQRERCCQESPDMRTVAGSLVACHDPVLDESAGTA